MKKYSIEKLDDFDEWFLNQTPKTQGIITARFTRIELDGYFGTVKPLEDGLFELKWKNGLRIYFAYLAKQSLIVILGGNKNGQSKDIKKAKSYLK